MKSKRIICLYGGAGSGKSTTCAGLFYRLKLLNYNCEMNREYIKDWCWEGRTPQEGDQTYFFAKQSRLERIYIKNKLDYIITDSPLILTHFYGLKYDKYEQNYNTSLMMLKSHHAFCKENDYKIEHYFIKRSKPYNSSGRYETAETAEGYDVEIQKMLADLGIKYKIINGDECAVDNILKDLQEEL